MSSKFNQPEAKSPWLETKLNQPEAKSTQHVIQIQSAGIHHSISLSYICIKTTRNETNFWFPLTY